MVGQPGFFDLSDRYAALSAAGDPLERLGAVVDFEVFRGPLIVALRRSDRGKGGRPPFDPVMMFKILVLQALYSLSDEATEFQIKDRLSFQRFLGLGLDGRVPDATTVWLFRERLVQAKAIDKLFARFDAALTDRGYLAMGGQIIDATVVPAPRQRNTEDEKAAIKQGKIPERWKERPAKVRQKDRDARWTVKYSKAKVKEGGVTPSPMPPKGKCGLVRCIKVPFTVTPPAVVLANTSLTTDLFSAKTYNANGCGRAVMNSLACLVELMERTGNNGPKISSFINAELISTSASTVGAT